MRWGTAIIGQMLGRLYFADLVLADMTIPNGNVYYEVGIRHAAQKTGCVLLSADWQDFFSGTASRHAPTAGRDHALRLENIEVEMLGLDLLRRDRLPDLLQAAQRSDRVELLHARRIDIAAAQCLKALRRQFGVVAGVAKELRVERAA